MPHVSVIVPNYNHAPWLRERLDSILNQTWKDFELVVLDDCSTDNSVEILEGYQSRYGFKLVLNSRNSGSPFAQWNRGVSLAAGEYVWIAESDDSCEKDFLETMVALLDDNQRAGLAFCRSWLIDEHGRRLRFTPGSNPNYDESRYEKDFFAEGQAFCAAELAFRSTIPNASAVLFRKRAFQEVGGADASMQLGGDWFTWVKMLEKWDIAFSAKPLNLYRMPHSQTQRRAAAVRKAPIAEFSRVMRFVVARFPVTQETRSRARYYLAHLLLEFAAQSLVRGRLRAFSQALKEASAFDRWVWCRVLLVLIRQSWLRLQRTLRRS